jgi:murein DD-endopeptidase MepM/ murein hydrolase activator NlpD
VPPVKRAWYLGGAAVVVVALIVLGTLLETRAPAALAPPIPSPSSMSSTSATTAAVAPVLTPTATPTAVALAYTFPVVGSAATYARTHHDYPAADIIAPCNSHVLAVTDGVILEVSRKDTYDAKADDGALRGGLSVSLLGNDGVRYYGSHFRSIQAGIEAGVTVRHGDLLGLVGDSGDASVCHLHFGISPPCARTGDWWTRRGAIWPAPYLDAWRQNKPSSPAAEVATWSKAHGCPGAP